jgi:sugar/nucleoside kinase (ribokinase family)
VIGLGLCVVDQLYVLDGLELDGERTRYREHVVSAGGMATTAMAEAARLGCASQLVSVLGDDAYGREVRRQLRAAGVGTRLLLRSARVPTTVAVVFVAHRGGARRFVVADRRAVERRAPALDVRSVRRGAVLLIDGHFPDDALRAVQRAAEQGVPVVADFHRPTPAALRLLPFVDHAIVPETFAAAFTPGRGRDTLFRLRDEFGCNPVLTQGARGGLWLAGARVRRFRSPRVRVRDTTGAGDAFHGAFAAGLAQALSLPDNLARAARSGARCCTGLGGVASVVRSVR